MNEILRSAVEGDEVNCFDMSNVHAVRAVLAAVGGKEAKCYRFNKTLLSGRLWNARKDDDRADIIGYVIDAQGAEVIKTMKTEKDPEMQARCTHIFKMFK